MTASWPLVPATVDAIGAMPAGPVRNRLITQTYHVIADELAALADPPVANWFHFATWASKSIGAILGGEVLPHWLRWLLVGRGGVLGDRDHAVPILGACEEGAARIAGQLAHGNVLVFRQMAPAAVAFLQSRTGPDAERAAAAERLRGLLAAGAVVRGTNALAEGFAALATAADSPRDPLVAQHVLGSALMLGAEEQYRLQGVLAAVLSSIPDDVEGPLERRLPSVALRRLGRTFDRWWDGLMTREFLVLVLPGEQLRLGADVPARPGHPLAPSWISEPRAPSLRAALATWDRTGGTGRQDGARDWADLGDRMDWITWCFASRLDEVQVRSAPFTPAEVERLRRALGVDPAQSVQRFSRRPTRSPR